MNALDRVSFADMRGRRLLAALSGGADSTALLHLLAARREADDLQIVAAHFNHRIRGTEADADEAFCRALCASLNIELICGCADVPTIAKARGIGLETCARELRYAFLRDAKQQCGADRIVLAHHADDQAETVLMHLLRGAGPEGICGMDRASQDLYRPLLELRHRDLTAYLESIGADWREDSTNAQPDSPRNMLRLNVLPEIERSYPMAVPAIARYAASARVESDFVAAQTDSYLKAHLRKGVYGKRLDLTELPCEAILRRSLRRICGADLNAAKLDALVELSMCPRGKTEIFGSLTAERTPSALYFLPNAVEKPAPEILNVPGTTLLPGICEIRAETGSFPIEYGNPEVEVLDADALEGAVLRTWRQGDRISLLGGKGGKLLSDCWTDRHIDRPLRAYLPLIAVGSEVLWAFGAGISDDARIQAATRRSVRLNIKFYLKDDVEVHHEK